MLGIAYFGDEKILTNKSVKCESIPFFNYEIITMENNKKKKKLNK